jgi:hypothetical protein
MSCADQMNCYEKMQADAQRYRWLKRVQPYALAVIAWRFPGATQYGSNEVDRAIDAAMEEERKQ